MKQQVVHGAVFDFATPDEIHQSMSTVITELFQERARGIAPWRFMDQQEVSGDAVTLPATGEENLGPNPGYAVLVQAVRGQGMTGNDVISIYRGTGSPAGAAIDGNFVGQLTVADPVEKFGSRGLLLKGGEFLAFTGASLSASLITVNGEGVEVPEPDLYKLLSP
jgi:hypothetical protein